MRTRVERREREERGREREERGREREERVCEREERVCEREESQRGEWREENKKERKGKRMALYTLLYIVLLFAKPSDDFISPSLPFATQMKRGQKRGKADNEAEKGRLIWVPTGR
jgi:hypothetical protein